MMKNVSKVLLFAASASLLLSSCGNPDGHGDNSFYYNNYSGADTEGYGFLKIVAEEANFQQLAATKLSDSGLANEIKQTYGELAKSLEVVSLKERVLTPNFPVLNFEDSAAVRVDVRAEIIKSQEVIVGQFKRVLLNTNTAIADYARENLPNLEKLLAETKASQ